MISVSALIERTKAAARAFADRIVGQHAGPAQLLRQVGKVRRQDRWSGYPGADLTPEKLKSIINEADRGWVRRFNELLDDSTDFHYRGCLQTRYGALIGCDWELTGSVPEIVEECRKMLKALPAFEDASLALLGGIDRGFAAAEIIYDWVDGYLTPVDILPYGQGSFWINTVREDWPVDQLRFLTDDAPTYGVELPPEKFIVFRPKLHGWLTQGALGRSALWEMMIKSYARTDWSTFVDVFGMPMRIGRYEPGTPPEDVAALKAELIAMGTDAVATVSKLQEIIFQGIQGQSSGEKVFPAICEYCDAQMTKGTLGHVASADAVANSLGGSEKTASGVRQDVLRLDNVGLGRSWTRDLLTPYCYHRWGAKAPVPQLSWMVEPAEDLESLANQYSTLCNIDGFAVPDSHLRATFNVPKPKPDEPVVGRGASRSLDAAQVSAILQVIERVVSGAITRGAGAEVISACFGIPVDRAERIMEKAEGGQP